MGAEATPPGMRLADRFLAKSDWPDLSETPPPGGVPKEKPVPDAWSPRQGLPIVALAPGRNPVRQDVVPSAFGVLCPGQL